MSTVRSLPIQLVFPDNYAIVVILFRAVIIGVILLSVIVPNTVKPKLLENVKCNRVEGVILGFL